MIIDKAEVRRRFKIANDLFRKKFKEQRERLRMSLDDIGLIFGISNVSIGMWERGVARPYCGMTIALQVMLEMEPRKGPNNFGKGNGSLERRGRPRKYSRAQMEEFARRFKRTRERLNLSQVAVARILGTSRGSVWNWEHGMNCPECSWEHVISTLKNKSTNPPDSP